MMRNLYIAVSIVLHFLTSWNTVSKSNALQRYYRHFQWHELKYTASVMIGLLKLVLHSLLHHWRWQHCRRNALNLINILFVMNWVLLLIFKRRTSQVQYLFLGISLHHFQSYSFVAILISQVVVRSSLKWMLRCMLTQVSL